MLQTIWLNRANQLNRQRDVAVNVLSNAWKSTVNQQHRVQYSFGIRLLELKIYGIYVLHGKCHFEPLEFLTTPLTESKCARIDAEHATDSVCYMPFQHLCFAHTKHIIIVVQIIAFIRKNNADCGTKNVNCLRDSQQQQQHQFNEWIEVSPLFSSADVDAVVRWR